MASDIVERLRWRIDQHAKMQGNALYYTLGCAVLDQEAAAEIDRLRATNERLRAALEPFAKACPDAPSMTDDRFLGQLSLTIGQFRAALFAWETNNA